MIEPRHFGLLWAGLLIAFGLVLVAVMPIDPRTMSLMVVSIGFMLGTFFGSATLAAVWTAWGPRTLVSRLLLSITWLAALLIAFAINIVTHGSRSDVVSLVVYGGCLVGQWVVAQVPLWGLTIVFGLRLQHASEPRLALDRRQRQFGIRQLMVLTAIVAVVLGMGRMVAMQLLAPDENHPGGGLWIIVLLAIAGVVMTLPLVLSALLPRFAVPASLLVLILIGLGTQLEVPLIPWPSSGAALLYAINGFQAAWVLAVIGALRLGGYGLAVRARSADADRPSDVMR